MLTPTPKKRTARRKTPAADAKRKPPTTKAKAKKSSSPSDGMRDLITAALEFNKAEDITALDLRENCSFTDHMVVASGRSARHVASLAEHVVDSVRKGGGHVLSVEGKDLGDWVLIDAGDVVVHIFRPEVRQFYNIEKMWAIPLH
jgi:ribosome-associated protein